MTPNRAVLIGRISPAGRQPLRKNRLAERSYDAGMTSPQAHTTLSVRGEAQRVVAADQATIYVSGTAIADSKQEAHAAVAHVLDEVVNGLAELGGAVLDAGNTRASLTWSTQSIRTTAEYGHDKVTGSGGPTGRHVAEANLVVSVRDFGLLGRLEAVLTASDSVSVRSVQWSVDTDNPEWALVRADAIRVALLKGQDYAAALNGSVTGVEHVADAGLLDGSNPDRTLHVAASRMSAVAAGGDGASLDPVPQVLTATIEARLTATISAGSTA
jgi:uncharacterized protein YggE